jgi:hypothetical protein
MILPWFTMVYPGFKLRVKMLTSAKNGKQNGDTRTRKPEPGYLNLSTDPTADPPWDIIVSHAHE